MNTKLLKYLIREYWLLGDKWHKAIIQQFIQTAGGITETINIGD